MKLSQILITRDAELTRELVNQGLPALIRSAIGSPSAAATVQRGLDVLSRCFANDPLSVDALVNYNITNTVVYRVGNDRRDVSDAAARAFVEFVNVAQLYHLEGAVVNGIFENFDGLLLKNDDWIQSKALRLLNEFLQRAETLNRGYEFRLILLKGVIPSRLISLSASPRLNVRNMAMALQYHLRNGSLTASPGLQ